MSGSPPWTLILLRILPSVGPLESDGDMITLLQNWGMVPFPNSEPMGVNPGHILPLIGFTKVGEKGPEPPLPTILINVAVPMTFFSLGEGGGDSFASIMGKLPHPLGKTKPRQSVWHQVYDVSALEFQNALQIARAVQPTAVKQTTYNTQSHVKA